MSSSYDLEGTADGVSQSSTGWQPKFGDPAVMIFASEDNPQRNCFFVRKGYRSGRLNHGHYYELTDKKGSFWTAPMHVVKSASPNPLPTTEGVTHGWHLIAVSPEKAAPVLYFHEKAWGWITEKGRDRPFPINEAFPDYRDERYSIGFFDGEEFREAGTGHAVFEFIGDEENDSKPTHWMPLPPPPQRTNT